MSDPFDPDAWTVGEAFDSDAWQRDVILRNVEKDPHYAPYCMRCSGLVRMRVVEQHYWRCRCGAQCDYRGESS